MANKDVVKSALQSWNQNNNFNFGLATSWVPAMGSQFENFVNNYLVPKVTESSLQFKKLGNRYEFLAEEVPDIGALSEEFVLLDSVPFDLDITSEIAGLFKTAFPKIASTYYGKGRYKVLKWTLDTTISRQGFQTYGDAINYALRALGQKLNDINVSEEKEMLGSIVNYTANHMKQSNVRTVVTQDDFINEIWKAILNMQNNSSDYNETDAVLGQDIWDRGGSDELVLGRHTTKTSIDDILIVTTDDIKVYLLGTKIANTFANEGLDISNHIISHNKFGGVYSIDKDIEIKEPRTLAYLKAIGYFDFELGSILKAGTPENKTLITFDPSPLTEFKGCYTELTLDGEANAIIFDKNALRYKRTTQGMIGEKFHNPANRRDEHFIHYNSQKIVSPFYNKIRVKLEG